MDRAHFIASLASDLHGMLNVGNLLLALQDNFISKDDFSAWVDDAICLIETSRMDTRYAGWQAVWNRTDRYQRRGPEAMFTHGAGERLIVFCTEAKLRRALHFQTHSNPALIPPPTGSADLLATYLLEQGDIERSNNTPRLSVFLPKRLVFYTRLEGEISLKRNEIALETDQDEQQSIALFLLRYMGLPVAGGEQWLMTIFRPWSGDVSLLRPTAFDGIDGAFFRQRPQGDAKGNWGRAADLNTCGSASYPIVQDGGVEAIGDSLHAIDLEDCVVLPRMPVPSPDDARLGSLYSQSLLKHVVPSASDWLDAIKQFAVYL